MEYAITTPVNKIKGRSSYKEFKQLHALVKDGTPEDILMKVHAMIDRRSGFGSFTNSNAAMESIKFILQE